MEEEMHRTIRILADADGRSWEGMYQLPLFHDPACARGYHNTNAEHGEALRSSRERAAQQQGRVLAVFLAHPHTHFSPCDIFLRCPGILLTSVRRAITNLTEEGLLEKTDRMKLGVYGSQVHTWRLAPRGEGCE